MLFGRDPAVSGAEAGSFAAFASVFGAREVGDGGDGGDRRHFLTGVLGLGLVWIG